MESAKFWGYLLYKIEDLCVRERVYGGSEDAVYPICDGESEGK